MSHADGHAGPQWQRETTSACAARLGISHEAVELFHSSEVIDLHVDTFIWQRLFGYDVGKRHGQGLCFGCFYSQVDLPRLRQVGVGGATWVITTNPFRRRNNRRTTFQRNLEQLRSTFKRFPHDVVEVKTLSDYRRARHQDRHGAFIGIQGGNALDDSLEALDARPSQDVLRVTLVHLSSSQLGATSSPAGMSGAHLSDFGREYVRILNKKKIFVDLAHIHPRGFYDALAASDPSQPPLVTHTGVSGVYKHWRNLDDAQLKSIADRGGTVGIMYHGPFLGPGLFAGRHDRIVAHIVHAMKVMGEDCVSLGSDWDGAIVTPTDLRTCLELPRLVQGLLNAGVTSAQVQKILGGNFLRVLKELRG